MEGAPEERRSFIEPRLKARRYQLEVLDKALEENTILFLETGCGKTLIAVLWIEALSHLIRKPSKKIGVFLVPNVALVEQQANEIEVHTDLKIGKFWGSMGEISSWDNAWWQEQIVKYEVFVMTPQILLNNLHHCFLRMEIIELLVFDECHRAQKEHPYARIMTDFYHGKKHCLPKIFGLTASPVNGKAGGRGGLQKIDSELHKLESMLDGKMYTVKDRMELDSSLPNPRQYIREYQPSYAIEHVKNLSGLLRKLRTKYVNSSDVAAHDCQSLMTSLDMKLDKKEMDDVSKVYLKLDWCIHELGLWCTIEAAEILLNKEGLRLGDETLSRGVKEAFLRDALLMLKAANWTDQIAHGGARYDIDEALMSPKLRCLVDVIKETRENFTKGIVFVDRVVATGAMSSILNRLKCLSFIKCLPMVGSQSMSQKYQQQAIDEFRSHEVNMLVATDIAEEGLDIQSCSMVVRFDGVPKTTRSYIQSRGRARQKGSTFIVLLERGNQDQFNDVIQLMEKEKLMWEFSENRDDIPTVIQEPETSEVELYEVESTGARVTAYSSIPLLYRYCSRLPGDEFYQPVPEFAYFQEPAGIVCKIRLPGTAPFQQVTGHPSHTEKLARRVAGLAACKRLHEVGALTDHLLPKSELEGTVETGDDNGLNLRTNRLELHSTLVPEGFRGGWANACANVSLFGFALHIVAEPKDREYADVALFLEADLDNHITSSVTDLYLKKGRTVKIQLVSCGQLEFDVDQLRDAKRFQERIFSMTFDPKAEQDPRHRSLPTEPNWDPGCLYLILPILPSSSTPFSVDWKSVRILLTEIVSGSPPFIQALKEDYSRNECHMSDLDSVSKFCTSFQMKNGLVPVEAVINSLVETTHNGNQYIVEDVLWDMDCESLLGVNPSSSQNRYVDYYKKSHDVDILHPKQRLLKAKPLKKMYNLLLIERRHQDRGTGSTSNADIFSVELPPELCCIKVLGFSLQLMNTLSLIPSFMHRVECFLLATQLHKKLKAAFSEAAKVSSNTVFEALTTAKCEEILSLERLEFFGDSFLKFAVSKHLFLVYNESREGELTKMRENVICNSSLHQKGVAKKLAVFIHDEHFNPLHWSAPGRPCLVHCDATNRDSLHPLQLGADGSNSNQVKCSERHRWLQQKVVADVVEALIGAHLVDGGPEAALAFLEWVGITVYADRNLVAKASTRYGGDIRFVQGKDFSELQKILGYSFKNKSTLVEALTHLSYRTPFGNCCEVSYQRLEFLGDAVLDFLITSHLYDTFKTIDPGDLTHLRSAIVCNESFSRVAVRHNLQNFLLHGSTNLEEQVKKFVSRGSEHFYGWECDKGPKVLADLVESLAGAVLVDSGFDIGKVWTVFEPLLQPIVTPETLHLHPVQELGELCDEKKFEYEYLATSEGTLRLGNYKVNTGKETIVTQAEKPDNKSARRLAAYEMLGKLKNLGWQHRYRALTTSLISQGRLEPLGEVTDVGKQGDRVDELESSVSKPTSIFEPSDENPTLSSMRKGVSFTAEKEIFRVAENHPDPSKRVADQLHEKHLREESQLHSPTSLSYEAPGDKCRLPPQTISEILEDRRKLEASRFPVQLESFCPKLSDRTETIDSDPVLTTAEEMHLLSNSITTLEPFPFELVSDEIATPEATYLKLQEDSSTSDRLLDTSHFAAPVSEDTHINPVHLSSNAQLLITALVRRPPAHQLSNVGAGVAAATKESFKEESRDGAASSPDPVQRFINAGDMVPSSTRKENPSGWGSNANSCDENVGRPREDLHNLCAKHRWGMPSYEPCPDYPQGPPHAPRFAFLVKLSCSLMNSGHIKDYYVECEGEPMNNKSRAMDSAASHALAWLQDKYTSIAADL